jgi:fatty acid desaturase
MNAASWKSVEWPTVLLFAAVYALWICVTAYLGHVLQGAADQSALQVFWQGACLYALLALLLTQHSSLQHEVIHGHPTRSRLVNSLLVMPAPGLLLPYERFEALHLSHHRDWLLTDPFDDTESYFLSSAQWQALSTPHQALLHANNTLSGRLFIGPWIMYVRFFRNEYRLLRQGAAGVAGAWARHIAGALPVVVWLSWLQIPLVHYLLFALWPATAMLLLRAYSEHLPAEDVTERTAIIETGPLLGLLFLHNNLHRVHHDYPSLSWYRIPVRYRECYARSRVDGTIKGYRSLFRSNAFHARFPVAHPVLHTRAAQNQHPSGKS